MIIRPGLLYEEERCLQIFCCSFSQTSFCDLSLYHWLMLQWMLPGGQVSLVLGLSSSAQCSLLSCSRWALAFYFYYFKGALKTFASFRTVKPFRSLVLPLQSSVTILSSCSVDAASSTAGLLTLLQPRWAFVCDHPRPSNLVNFNTLAFWLNRTSCHSWRNYSLCHNSSTGRTHTCLIRSSVMLGCPQQKTSLT